MRAPRSSGGPQHFVTRIGRIERIWRIAPRAVMHAVATSPDDLFFGTAARDATKSVLGVCYKEKKEGLLPIEWAKLAENEIETEALAG